MLFGILNGILRATFVILLLALISVGCAAVVPGDRDFGEKTLCFLAALMHLLLILCFVAYLTYVSGGNPPPYFPPPAAGSPEPAQVLIGFTVHYVAVMLTVLIGWVILSKGGSHLPASIVYSKLTFFELVECVNMSAYLVYVVGIMLVMISPVFYLLAILGVFDEAQANHSVHSSKSEAQQHPSRRPSAF